MEKLGLYIKEALKDRQQIYLPGIGTFKKNRIPAFFDDQKQAYCPPNEEYLLTDEKTAEGSFVDFICVLEGVSAEKSRLYLEQAVADLQRVLNAEGKVTIKGIGVLVAKDQGIEMMQPASNTDEYFEDYDVVAERETFGPIAKSLIKSGEREAAGEINPMPEVAASAPPEISVDDEQPEDSTKRWLWPTIGVAVAVVLAGIWFLNPSLSSSFSIGNGTENTLGSATPAASVENKADINTPSEASQELTAAQVADTTRGAELIVADSTESSVDDTSEGLVRKPQGNYEIIIAAFETMEEAESYVLKTNAKGHNVYILKNNRPGNLNKVSYSSFDTATDAEEALIKVRQELTKDAWTYKVKKSINN